MEAHEAHKRSVVKSVSYRAIHLTVDFVVAFFVVRDATLSLLIVLLVNGYSTLLYYFHERVWAHITWGRRVS